MGDDDWDTPSSAPSGGGFSDGGTGFSAGRGFAPAKPSRQQDEWGSGDQGAQNGGDDTWGDAGGESSGGGGFSSWGNKEEGGFGGGRGGRGGRGRGGRGGFRGGRGGENGGDRGDGFRKYDDDDGEGGGRRGGRGGGRGGRGRGGFRGGENNGGDDFGANGEEGGTAGEEGERKPVEHYIPTEKDGEEELFNTGIASGVNFMKLDDIDVKATGTDPPPPIQSFEESGLRPLLLDNVKKSGYIKPTPIQKYSIPAIMNKRDLMSCAQTGSGKTAAFLLPMINHLLASQNPPVCEGSCSAPNVVIISPTRELTSQIYEQAKKFAFNSIVKVVQAYGGTSTVHQRNNVLAGCHILVATPGRLKDFVTRGYISFQSLEYFVLDEADRMLDMGFLSSVEEMLSHPSMPATGERQTLMFSATFPEEIQQLAAKFLHNYVFITVGIVGSASTDVEQVFHQVSKFEKRNKLLSILNENPEELTLIFVETKRNADFLATFLSENNIQSTSIHGDRLQREREMALSDFRRGVRKIMVATGVAARGLDIKGVQHVVNYDLPNSIDEYVHRIGRTGRVGNRGKATSFFDDSVDNRLADALGKILTQAKQEVPEFLSNIQYHGGSSDRFGGRDIRGDDFGRAKDLAASSAPPAEEEEW